MIEEGKYYQMRNGVVVGPMIRNLTGNFYVHGVHAIDVWGDTGSNYQYWHPDGQVMSPTRYEEHMHLVGEAPAPAPTISFDEARLRLICAAIPTTTWSGNMFNGFDDDAERVIEIADAILARLLRPE